MERELKALYSAIGNVEKPCVYVLGGVKVDDSIMVMENVFRGRERRLYAHHWSCGQHIPLGTGKVR